ncbi:hypothetical protein [Streptomyces pseudogriseolus]|uniref:hypothetical protein n=1 Tax=Streptomyces pseudogriseolus TaxID=36817 RepID=UPI003FA31017
MQPEAIATLVAAGAAVLGVPAALAVGFRQARAARHAAELAVRAAHDQARRTAQRDAAVQFVLAIEKQFDASRRIGTGKVPLDQAEVVELRRVSRLALTVFRLESPESLAGIASETWRSVELVTEHALFLHPASYAKHVLQEAAHDGNRVARASLSQLAKPFAPQDPEQRATWTALREADVLSAQQFRSLRAFHRNAGQDGRDTRIPIGPMNRQASKAVQTFVNAVRAYLNQPG